MCGGRIGAWRGSFRCVEKSANMAVVRAGSWEYAYCAPPIDSVGREWINMCGHALRIVRCMTATSASSIPTLPVPCIAPKPPTHECVQHAAHNTLAASPSLSFVLYFSFHMTCSDRPYIAVKINTRRRQQKPQQPHLFAFLCTSI